MEKNEKELLLKCYEIISSSVQMITKIMRAYLISAGFLSKRK